MIFLLLSIVLAQEKAKPKHLSDSPFQPAISYMASGGIGMRWRKHYFDNPFETEFVDGQTHLEESRERRLQNIRIQTQHQPPLEDDTPLVYLSHIYYTPRLDAFDTGISGVATAQNGILPVPGQEGKTCPQPEPEEIDLTKEVVRSNRIKMGLAQFGCRDEQVLLRSSALMSHAFHWTPSVELPVDRIEQNENEQLIETFFAKMAKTQYVEFFNHFQSLLSRWKNAADRPNYWTSFYTVDQPLHPVSKMGGILEGVQAIDITHLQRSKSPEAFSFFREKILVQPNYITFNQISILLPEQRKFVITNVQRQGDIQIENILTCSPELSVYLPRNQYYPVILSPGETITLTVIVAPETWGLLQTAIIVSFSNMLNLMLPITSFHIANEYDLEPVYFTNVNVGEQVQGQIRMKNPSAIDEIEIVEVYSSEEYLKLYWPNSVQLASTSEAQSNRDFSKYLKIEPGAKAKQILTYHFETDQVVDHRAVIHMVTSLGDVIRIPLYFHVYPDLLKFTPSIVDFGLVAYRFDALRVPVSVTIRNGFDVGILYLSEVLLPVSEKRLDFSMGRWDRDSFGNIQVYNKQSMRLEEQRRGVLHKDRTLELFTIILDPTAFGEINTQVVLVFTTEEGKEFRVELPVVGHVMKQNNVLLEDSNGNGSPNYKPQSVAKPAITLNVKPYLSDSPTLTQLLKSKRVEERLIVYNNLGATLKGFEVIEMFPEAVFAYQSGSSSKQSGSSKSAELQVGQSLQLGSFYINTKDLKTTAGRHYFFLQTNQNLFVPMAIEILDQNLVCSFIPHDMTATRHQDCQSGVALDFQKVALNKPISKYLNVTNTGSEPVSIDWISTTGDNEVFINFLALDPPPLPGSLDFILGSYRGQSIDHQKKRITGMLQPRQTVTIEIGIEAYISTNFVSQKKATFQFSPHTYGQLKVNISYSAQPGTAFFSPKRQTLKFPPTYVGAAILQTEVITFQSKLPSKVLLRQVSVDNPHFKVTVINSKLKDKSEVLRISFDPNEQKSLNSVALSITNHSDHSQVLQRVINQDSTASVTKQNAPTGKFSGVSKTDVSKYRQSQEHLFQSRKKAQSTMVTGTLRIETDQLSVVEYQLEAEIIQPTILTANSIDFGTVQVGSSAMRSLTIHNPFAEALQVQLYVGRTTSEIEAELKRLKLLANEKKVNSILDARNHVQQSILQTLNYTRFHCRLDEKDPSEEVPIYLKREAPQGLACRQVLNMLQRYDSIQKFNQDKQLWAYIEEYFKQIILASVNFEINYNLDAFSKEQIETLGLLSRLEQHVQSLVFQSESSFEDIQAQPVDQQIVNDMTFCTQQKPYLSVNHSHFEDLTFQVGFPNVVDYYLPIRPTLKLAFNTLTAPLKWSYLYVYHLTEQETWLDCFNYTLQATTQIISDFASLFKRKQMQLRPEEFMTARSRDKQYLPPATATNTIQFLDNTMHKQLVANHGSSGADRNVQSFFLNQKFNKVITIAANSSIILPNAIIYEPPAYINGDGKSQMLLYIKTDQTPLQTMQLTGTTGSSLIELTLVNKLSQGPSSLTSASQQVFSNNLIHVCNDEKAARAACNDYVSQQIFGRSQLTPLIQLSIDVKDALGSIEHEQMYRIAASDFFTRITTFFALAFSQITSQNTSKGPDLPSQYKWVMTFKNTGNQPWTPTKFGFEDPKTGEISCRSGDLELNPCQLTTIKTQGAQTVELTLHADYSTLVYKKTLVFESASHIQRFPLSLSTDLRLLDFASQFGRTKAWQSEFIRSISLVFISLLLLAYKQILKLRQKLPKPQPQPILVQEPNHEVEVPVQIKKPEKPKIKVQKPEAEVVQQQPIVEMPPKVDIKDVVLEVPAKVEVVKPYIVSRMNKKERKAFEQRRREQEHLQQDDANLEAPPPPVEHIEQAEQPQETFVQDDEARQEVVVQIVEAVQAVEAVEEWRLPKETLQPVSEEQSAERIVEDVQVEPDVLEKPQLRSEPSKGQIEEPEQSVQLHDLTPGELHQAEKQKEQLQNSEQSQEPIKAPKPKVQEKVKAPKPFKEPYYRTVDRSFEQSKVEYVPKKHQAVQQWRQPVKQILEQRQDPYDYFERKPEPKGYARPIRRHEEQYYYEPEMYHKHAYHRNRDWHYDDEIDYAPEHNEYFDEYQDRYEPKQDLHQYQNVPKRQYWPEPQKQYKPFQKQYKPAYSEKLIYPDKVYPDRPVYPEKIYSDSTVYPEKQVHVEKPYSEHKPIKMAVKPMSVPQNQQTLWKAKPKEPMRPEIEEEEKQRPVSNFYNAFKSIQTMFNQKAVVVQSRANSQDREEKASFRDQSESELQPRFSLFGDSIWGNDTPKPDVRENLFKPLRQFNNTMFTDSLESLKKPEPQPEEKYRLF